MKMPNDRSTISRRRFIVSTGLTAAALSLRTGRLFAAEQNIIETARRNGEAANITAQALRSNVSALIGSGGNIAVLSGPEGKLLVDSGYAGSRAKMTEALNAISPAPLKHVINTHWHFDHTDGNEWLHSAGAAIVA